MRYHPSHQRVRRAVLAGKLPDLKKEEIPCTDCKVKRAQVYDHRDYEKPLDVEPVCLSCNAIRGRGQNRHSFFQRVRRSVDGMNPLYTTLSVSVRRDLALKVKKLFPRYGALSKAMQRIFQDLVDGRLKIK